MYLYYKTMLKAVFNLVSWSRGSIGYIGYSPHKDLEQRGSASILEFLKRALPPHLCLELLKGKLLLCRHFLLVWLPGVIPRHRCASLHCHKRTVRFVWRTATIFLTELSNQLIPSSRLPTPSA